MDDVTKKIEQVCKLAKNASRVLAKLTTAQKNKALKEITHSLLKAKAEILAVNKKEVQAAKHLAANDAFLDRMTLDDHTFDGMVTGVKKIIALDDPVGRVLASWHVPSELSISRVSVPLGVISVVYESRPNVTVDAATLCLKAGNAIILRGGSECEQTNRAIVTAMQKGLSTANVTDDAIQYIPFQEREAISVLLKMDKYIDVIIPRGGKSLIKRIAHESSIPVFLHLDGICHTYIHKKANLDMAVKVIVNAKMRRPGICGATETLLIDESVAKEYLPTILSALHAKGCEVRGDTLTQSLDSRVKPATMEDWDMEYLDAILAVKVVKNIDEAIAHINQHGSHHTDAIITESASDAAQFLQEVDSANVMHNCSTQFADGGEFGMGAEIGIATGKLHARGPVGLEQLTTFKYVVKGAGQVRP